jgi:hypothetical protein
VLPLLALGAGQLSFLFVVAAEFKTHGGEQLVREVGFAARLESLV